MVGLWRDLGFPDGKQEKALESREQVLIGTYRVPSYSGQVRPGLNKTAWLTASLNGVM